MGLRIKNFNIMGGSPKSPIFRGFGQFQELRGGGLGKKDGGCCDTLNAHYEEVSEFTQKKKLGPHFLTSVFREK